MEQDCRVLLWLEIYLPPENSTYPVHIDALNPEPGEEGFLVRINLPCFPKEKTFPGHLDLNWGFSREK
jgi:hypothetical protein